MADRRTGASGRKQTKKRQRMARSLYLVYSNLHVLLFCKPLPGGANPCQLTGRANKTQPNIRDLQTKTTFSLQSFLGGFCALRQHRLELLQNLNREVGPKTCPKTVGPVKS